MIVHEQVITSNWEIRWTIPQNLVKRLRTYLISEYPELVEPFSKERKRFLIPLNQSLRQKIPAVIITHVDKRQQFKRILNEMGECAIETSIS